MAKKIKYRKEIEFEPDDYESGRFRIYLLNGKTEIGMVSGYVYPTDSFSTYGDVLVCADGMDDDEYTIIDEIIRLIESETRKHFANRFISKKFLEELFSVGIITIDRVYVLPEYRGQGYAKEVMSNIKNIVSKLFKKDFSIIGLIAHTFEPTELKNNAKLSLDFIEYFEDKNSSDQLVKLYKSVGFRVVKEELNGSKNVKLMVNGI